MAKASLWNFAEDRDLVLEPSGEDGVTDGWMEADDMSFDIEVRPHLQLS